MARVAVSKKRVTIKLYMRCECGHADEVKDFGDEMRVTPGFTNEETGTSWPGEIELVCPKCKGTDDSRTC